MAELTQCLNLGLYVSDATHKTVTFAVQHTRVGNDDGARGGEICYLAVKIEETCRSGGFSTMQQRRFLLLVTRAMPPAVAARAEGTFDIRMPGEQPPHNWLATQTEGDAILCIPV